MKRIVTLPHPKDRVYQALMDPILLAGWLDLPSVTTGYGKLHLFELEEWKGDLPWKVRGFILDNIRDEGFRVEKDEVGEHDKPTLSFRLTESEKSEDGERGCLLELESEHPYFERIVMAFLDPRGHLRLQHLLEWDAATDSDTA